MRPSDRPRRQRFSLPSRRRKSIERSDALAVTLSDKDPGVRATAAQTLGGLIVRIKNPKSDTKASPEQVDKWTTQAMNSVVKTLSDPDASVRAAGIVGLGLAIQAAGDRAWEGSDGSGGAVKRGGQEERRRGPRDRSAPRRLLPISRAHCGLDRPSGTRETAKAYYGYYRPDRSGGTGRCSQ